MTGSKFVHLSEHEHMKLKLGQFSPSPFACSALSTGNLEDVSRQETDCTYIEWHLWPHSKVEALQVFS